MKTYLAAIALMSASLSFAATTINCVDLNGSSKASLVYSNDQKEAKTPLTLTVTAKGKKTVTKCRAGFDVADEDMMNGITNHYCVTGDDAMDIFLKLNLKTRELTVTNLGFGAWPYTHSTEFKCD